MTIDRDLMLSLLAMDSYNRGYGQGITGLSSSNDTQIGNAIISADSLRKLGPEAQAAGFYATAYNLNGVTVISYRGTDDYSLFSRESDIWNGWTIGLGFNTASQAGFAISFYEAVTQMPLYNSAASNTILTGHSLGGGLAGFVGALASKQSYGFDHMPFGQAAWSEAFSQAYQRALASISGFTTADLILYLPFGVTGPLSSAFTIFVQTFTDQLAALRPYLQTMTGYHLQGEALSYVRSGFAGFAGAAGAELVGILFSVPQIGAQLASLGITSAIFTASTEPLVDEREISNNGLGLSPIELHSQALLTILLFGERQWGPEGGSSAWKRAFRFFGSKLIDDEIAAQSGLVRAAGNSLGTGRAASGLQIASMIAYSAINEGTLVFGDVRRQNIWHNLRRRLAECGLRLGVDVRRRACGIASADVRWSFA